MNRTPGPGGGNQPGQGGGDQSWRWIWTILIVAVLAVLVVPNLLPRSSATSLTYSHYLSEVKSGDIQTATIDNATGVITGKLANGTQYTTQGPNPYSQADVSTMRKAGVEVNFSQPSTSILGDIAPYLVLALIFVLLFWFMSRQARGQMSGIMSIGRSRARLYSSERPSTTFNDVAGYNGVKQEIAEVVDFLKTPARFKEIGAKIPKGVLLVGPRGRARRCWRGRWPARPASRSSR